MNESSAAMLEDGGIEADLESFYKHLFLIQDLYASGYRMADVGSDENGLVNNCNLITLTMKNTIKILPTF